MELKHFIEKYKVLLIVLAIVGIVFVLYSSEEKYRLFQNSIPTNIELPCHSFEECQTFLKAYGYTNEQIEESVFCEDDKCYMKGYIEYGKE